MKLKNIIVKGVLFISVAAAMWSCYDITDTQKEWLDKGEKIYVGKIDSMYVRSGMNRVEIVGNSKYLRTAVRCEVTYNNEKLDFAISDIVKDNGKVSIIIDNLAKGMYYFDVTTFDNDGNSSITTEVFGTVYGEEDLLTETPRRISAMTELWDGSLEIKWNDTQVDYFIVTYEDKDGKMQTMRIEGDVETTNIKSWKRNGKIQVSTYILKNKNDLDYLALIPVEYAFPEGLKEAIPRFNAGSKMYLGPISAWGLDEMFTMEIMARYTEFAGGDQCLISWECGAGGMMLRSSGSNLQFYISDTSWGWRMAGQTGLSLNEWYHFAITFKKGHAIELYVNGRLIGSNSCNGISRNDNAIFQIGTSPQYSNRYMRGDIRHVVIWDVVRTAEQIQSDMNHEFSLEEEGLKAYWPLTVNYGSSFPDLTGNWIAEFSNVTWNNVK